MPRSRLENTFFLPTKKVMYLAFGESFLRNYHCLMKKIIVSIFLINLCLPSLASAMQIDKSVIWISSPTIYASAKLNLDPTNKTISLQFSDKTLSGSIVIEKSLISKIRGLNATQNHLFSFRPEKTNDKKTLLRIVSVGGQTNSQDVFWTISSPLRTWQNNEEKKKFYSSFLSSLDIRINYSIPNLPFYPQAPFATLENWEIHEESCEEAAILLNHYITQRIWFDAGKMNQDILAANDFELQNGIIADKYSSRYNKYYLRDLTNPSEMYGLLGQNFLHYPDDKILLFTNPSIFDIERFIANKHILTVPMRYTKTFRNQYIRSGKSFHIVNIVGYDEQNFITLDPGTKNGKYLAYPKSLLFSSIQENGNYFIALKK